MSRGVNKVMLLGNVGQEPDIRVTSSGAQIAKLALATNRSWTDSSGQKGEKTEWHRLTVFGKLAGVVDQYVKKGDRLYVEGRIEYSTTVGDDGTKRYWTDIVVQELMMLGSNGGVGGNPQPDAPHAAEEPDDDLPF